MHRIIVEGGSLARAGAVTCPICQQIHKLEDLSVPRFLGEQCYFKCPGDGKEFEIVVRERVPADLQPVDAGMSALPDLPADEPGTMGGEKFLDKEEEEPPEIEDLGLETEEEVPAEDEEEEKDEKDKPKAESFTERALRLMRAGLNVGSALDLLECGDMGGDYPMPSDESPQIVINVGAAAEEEDALGMGADPLGMGPSVAHGEARMENRR